MELVHCPLFTEHHAHHNSVWSVPGYTLPVLCVACVVERLENQEELSLHIRKVLTELRVLLTEGSQSKLLLVLKSDKRVLEKLCSSLFRLLTTQEAAIKEQAIEVLMVIMNLAQDGDLILKLLHHIVHTVMGSQSLPCSLPHLTFLGKLLHAHPTTCNTMATSYVSFLEFILGGLTYPHDSVKSAVVYLLVQVCSKSQPGSLPVPLVQSMCRHISTNLATAKSQELTINLLGLVRHLLKSGMYTQLLLQADQLKSEAKGSTFASAFKRVLLSRDELLQVSAVQCVEEVLSHHMDYGRVLLTADIAEFLFEALSSKNELLISSLFSCLNSLASVDDFYTKCHVLYGVEAVVNGLATSMKLRAYTATQIGFSFLIKILKKQPSGSGLFPTPSILQKLLEVVSAALQTGQQPVVLQATSLLHNLLGFRHLPSGLPMSTLFPSLAMLLHLIEPMTMPTQSARGVALSGVLGKASDRKKLLCEVLATFMEVFRYAEESLKVGSSNVLELKQDDDIFLFKAFEESLLPALLLHMNLLDEPAPYAALFGMASCHMTIACAAAAHTFAKKLVQGAFVQLVFEMKAKFLNSEGYEALSVTGNNLLISMCSCVTMERVRDIAESASSAPADSNKCTSVVKSTLQAALPSMNCSIESCLQYLGQRVPSMLFQSHMTGSRGVSGGGGVPSIAVLQHATLILLHSAYSHDDILVAPVEVLRSLHKYLSLNPSIHLLHPTLLHCLASLFAEAIYRINIDRSEWIVGATQLLVEGLVRVPESLWTQLHSPGDATLLLWGLSQPALHHTMARTWLLQWIRSADTAAGICAALVRVLEKSLPAVKCLLSLLAETDGSVTMPNLEMVLHLLQLLVSKNSKQQKVRTQVVQSLQEIVTKQRVDPIPDACLAVLLKLLATALDGHQGDQSFDLKLVYRVTGIICKTEVKGEASASRSVAESGMNLLAIVLHTHSEDIQISTLLLNNAPFLHKIESILSDVTTPKAHSGLSASALSLIALLITAHFKLNRKASPHVVKLNLSSALSALSSPSIPAKVAGLELWRAIFMQEGRIDSFLQLDCTDQYRKNLNCPRVVLFLILNCLMHDSYTVKSAASECVMEGMNYMAKLQDSVLLDHWTNTFIRYLVEVHHTSSIPFQYLPFIANLLGGLKESSDCSHLKPLAQLLYKSYHNSTTVQSSSHVHPPPSSRPYPPPSSHPHPPPPHLPPSSHPHPPPNSHMQTFMDCFAKISTLERDLLTCDQWETMAI